MTEFFTDPDYPDFQEFGQPPCATTYPDAFFPEDAPEGNVTQKRGTYAMEREAKQVCSDCPYIKACLAYALKHPELMGIWGGTNDNQRRNIRRGFPVDLTILPPNRNR